MNQRPKPSFYKTYAKPQSQTKQQNKSQDAVKSGDAKNSSVKTDSRLNLRAQLVRLLSQVQQGRSLSEIQEKYFELVDEKDRGLMHELSFGVLRHWYALKSISLPMLNKPLSDPQLEVAIYLGLYQLFYTRIADHAAISETVEAVKQLGFESASGVINAILRRATREREQLTTELEQAHGLPSWLYKRLNKDWAEQLPELAQVLRQPAPLFLRVNHRQIGRDAYLKQLQLAGIEASASSISEVGIRLEQSVSIPALPSYDKGWFSVQDEHAQLCVSLLPNLNGKIVVDACAAPGGKTAHLLEKYRPQQLIALDNVESRLQRVHDNLNRLQLASSEHAEQVNVVCADATTWQVSQSSDAMEADCIIIDAPCTAIGVLRRHPDIRLLRQSTDIAQTTALQTEILENMWQQLKVGGQMLYITCSILKAENEVQMQSFFAHHADAKHIEINADWGIAQQYGRQFLPQQGGGDGFYYCLIEKVA